MKRSGSGSRWEATPPEVLTDLANLPAARRYVAENEAAPDAVRAEILLEEPEE